jgi:hypothetical protein
MLGNAQLAHREGKAAAFTHLTQLYCPQFNVAACSLGAKKAVPAETSRVPSRKGVVVLPTPAGVPAPAHTLIGDDESALFRNAREVSQVHCLFVVCFPELRSCADPAWDWRRGSG